MHDAACAEALLEGLQNGVVVVADKGYDADSIRAHIRHQGAVPNIPNRSNRNTKYRWTKALYHERNRVERFFNKLKQYRRIATHYDKLGANFFVASLARPGGIVTGLTNNPGGYYGETSTALKRAASQPLKNRGYGTRNQSG